MWNEQADADAGKHQTGQQAGKEHKDPCHACLLGDVEA
jgi:hypothetical protein